MPNLVIRGLNQGFERQLIRYGGFSSPWVASNSNCPRAVFHGVGDD
jgi:hypothetical protein